MNCPKCGAKWSTMTGGKAKFHCGSIAADEGYVCPQSELCKDIEHDKKQLELLRSKLTPEGAESLKWTQVSRYRIKSDCELLKLEIIFHNNGEAVLVGNVSTNRWHETIDAAKAHAEELHQASWREFKEKWGEEVKIKDLVWKKVFEGMYLARPILEGHAFVEQHDRIFWKYDFNGNTVTRFHSAKQAQDACNAEHKRLIAEWVTC